jgi:hypothetical protein
VIVTGDQFGDISIAISEVNRMSVPDVKEELLFPFTVFEQGAADFQPFDRLLKLLLRDLEGIVIESLPCGLMLKREFGVPNLEGKLPLRLCYRL